MGLQAGAWQSFMIYECIDNKYYLKAWSDVTEQERVLNSFKVFLKFHILTNFKFHNLKISNKFKLYQFQQFLKFKFQQILKI